MRGLQEALLTACVLPGCSNIVDQPGDACTQCCTDWGPYIARSGELSAWHPGWVPACHHGFAWWRAGKCDLCGSMQREAVR